jgi:hypothetical protein
MAWDVEPCVVSPSNDRWAGGTTADLFYKPRRTHPHLVVCVASVLCFFGIDDAVQWQELYRVDTGLDGIVKVCCVGNTVAIGKNENKREGRKLTVAFLFSFSVG